MTRVCNKCNVEQPIEKFYATNRDKTTGEVVTRKLACHACTAATSAKWRKKKSKSKAPVDHEQGALMLPIGPFREWLEDRLVRCCEGLPGMLARDLKVHDRQIYAWLHVIQKIHIDQVDRTLLNAGEMLRDVYPELYCWDIGQQSLDVAA